MHGFGSFIRLCGKSYRDAEAIWAVKCNTADGLTVHCPDGFSVNNIIYNGVAHAGWMRVRITYSWQAQTYLVELDMDDNGVYEWSELEPVDGRYVDDIVIGNSTAIQGQLGDFTTIDVDSVAVTGTAETVDDPDWAAPFAYSNSDGTTTRMSWLPTLLGGRISIDKDNQVDAAELELDNYGMDEEGGGRWQMYTWARFWNRRAIIQGRSTDGNGSWTPWETTFDGICAEKQLRLDEGGRCVLTLPIRDRWRAIADDMEVQGAYSDAGAAIDGVGMNMDIAEIMADIYANKCGFAAAAYNIVALPNNVPRNLQHLPHRAQQAVRTLCEQGAVACYQRRRDARVRDTRMGLGQRCAGLCDEYQ